MIDSHTADALALLDWKRKIAELYAGVRATPDKQSAWQRWHEARSGLFREHPQSPLPPSERQGYSGPYMFEYDPAWRALATVNPA
jgi:hypothetical protein